VTFVTFLRGAIRMDGAVPQFVRGNFEAMHTSVFVGSGGGAVRARFVRRLVRQHRQFGD
jgi:hypothetical protein